jgi:hypothetical protein
MDTKYKIALAALAGIGLGAAAIEGLHAQAKPPAYVVVAVRSIKDADAFKTSLSTKPRRRPLPQPAAATWSAPRR